MFNAKVSAETLATTLLEPKARRFFMRGLNVSTCQVLQLSTNKFDTLFHRKSVDNRFKGLDQRHADLGGPDVPGALDAGMEQLKLFSR